jgi:amino acid permease
MLKNLEKLKYTSFISFIATIYAGFLVVYVSTIPQSELQARGVITQQDIDVGFNETTV